MKSILFFLILQLLYFLFGMSDANQISLIVLSSAVVIFATAYIGVVVKERRYKKRLINALLNTN